MFSTRHIIKLIGALVCLAGVPLLTSCVDELFPRQSTDEIRFVPTVSDSWAAMGRSQSSPFRKAFEEYTVEKIEGSQGADGEQLYLHTQVQEGFQTNDPKIVPDEELKSRATLTTGTTFPYDEFRVSAYLFKDQWDENGYNANYFDNEVVQRKPDGSFDLMSKFFWPNQDGQKMRFRAYAPYTPKTSTTPLICEYKTDQPRRKDGAEIKNEFDKPINFSGVYVKTVSNLSQQRDVLIATTGTEGIDCRNHTNVQLTFKHALAAIRFVANGGLTGATLKSIEFENFWHSGVIDMDKEWLECQWDAAKLEFNINKYISSDDQVDLLDGQVMLFPPYKSLGWSHIWLNIEVNGVTKRVDIPFFHKTWEAGKTYTYRISNKDYTEFIDVEYDGQVASRDNIDIHYPYDGGIQSFQLSSYIGGVTQKPLAWKALFQPAGASGWSETPPSWLTLNMTSGSGVANGYTEIEAKTTIIDPVVVDMDQSVRQKLNGSSAQRYNLSTATTNNTIGTTANCYVADGCGYYMFPLVYGNAINKGSLNSEAYTGPNSADPEGETLSHFVDHLGNPIRSAYIEGQGKSFAAGSGAFTIKPDGAEVLWQDTPGLISNVRYVPDLFNHSGIRTAGITFDIPQDTAARQGNAIIGIKDSNGNIAWSWHIWVSPLGTKFTVPLKANDNRLYNIAAANLGWVSFNPIKDYRTRSCKIKFMDATGSGKFVVITIGQEPHAVLAPGDAMFYQWGRKDPFPGYGRNGATEPAFKSTPYDWPNLDMTKKAPKRDLLKWRIQHPTVFHQMARKKGLTPEERDKLTTIEMISDDLFINLWDAQRDKPSAYLDYTSTKTVYDPCPPGFKVPPPGGLNGLLLSKSDTGAEGTDKWNGTWDPAQQGLMVKASGHMISTLFPTCGYLDYDDFNNRLQFRGTDAYIWSSGAANHSSMYFTTFAYRTGYIRLSIFDYYILSNGYNVRPVKDETPTEDNTTARSRFRGPRSWGGGF